MLSLLQLQDAGCWTDAATLAATHLQGSDYARCVYTVSEMSHSYMYSLLEVCSILRLYVYNTLHVIQFGMLEDYFPALRDL